MMDICLTYLKRFILTALTLVVFLCPGWSQVTVTATGGVPTATYTTLKGSFDAVNNGLHSGIINIIINSSTTETATCSLNAVGGLTNYSRITIRPGAACTVTGNIAGPLIHLNGADSVTIDGRINGAGNTRSLTLQNTYNGNMGFAYVVLVSGGANKNKLQYLICEGLGQSTADNGTIYCTGNQFNKIADCEVKAYGTGWQSVGIYCNADTDDTISNNLVRDFMSQSSNSIGVGIYAKSCMNAQIVGNSIYQTKPVNSAIPYALNFILAFGGGNHKIFGNYIGGTAPQCGGDYSVFDGSGVNNYSVTGISINLVYSGGSIDSNIIARIKVINTLSLYSTFSGLIVASSPFIIGNYAGNLIGSTVDTGSIVVNNGTFRGIVSSGSISYSTTWIFNNKIGGVTARGGDAIAISAMDSAVINNNIIGGAVSNSIRYWQSRMNPSGIRISNGQNQSKVYCIGNTIRNVSAHFSTSTPSSFDGILNSSLTNDNGKRWIKNNTITNITCSSDSGDVKVYGIHSLAGGTNILVNNQIRANIISNIQATTVTPNSVVYGIYNESGYSSFLTIDSNSITNLSSDAANTNSNLNVSVQGIGMISSSNGPVNIAANKIGGLSNSSTAAAYVAGINCYYNNTTPINLAANRIYDLSNPNTTNGSVAGIMVGSPDNGYFLVKNNMIHLSPADGSVFGIHNYLGNGGVSAYYNSVLISGTSSGVNTSAAYVRVPFSNANTHLQNNIFENVRSGGTGNHYTVSNANVNPDTGWQYSNFNNLYSANPATAVRWGSTDYNFGAYQAATLRDTCSVNMVASFVYPDTGDLHLANVAGNNSLQGKYTSFVADDYDNQLRNAFPAIGADEINLSYQGAIVTGPTTVCPDGYYVLYGTYSPNMQWYRNGQPIPGATNDTLHVYLPGSYKIQHINGCLTNTSGAITITQLPITRDTMLATICPGSSYSFGGNSYSVAGMYTDSFTSVAGCDSLVTLILSVNTINDTITQTGNTLTALSSSGTYQWINCFNFSPMVGQTSQSFTFGVSGSYAVIISVNGCIDTSNCYTVATASIPVIPELSSVNAYPNPTSGEITFRASADIYRIALTDLKGMSVFVDDTPTGKVATIDMHGLAAGVYFYKVAVGDAVITGKILLQTDK